MSRPTLEVADVVRQYGDVFLERYGHQLNGTQLRALRAIEMCRTAALGGHVIQCDQCGHQEQSYNSCLIEGSELCKGERDRGRYRRALQPRSLCITSGRVKWQSSDQAP